MWRVRITARACCASAFVSVSNQQGESPCQGVLEFETVADRNCVAARRGGEHRKANGRSETQVNSIRPVVVASLLAKGEAEVPYRMREHQPAAKGRWLVVITDKSKRKLGDESDDGGWLESERLEGSVH